MDPAPENVFDGLESRLSAKGIQLRAKLTIQDQPIDGLPQPAPTAHGHPCGNVYACYLEPAMASPEHGGLQIHGNQRNTHRLLRQSRAESKRRSDDNAFFQCGRLPD